MIGPRPVNQRFWAEILSINYKVGPYDSRNKAVAECFKDNPTAKECLTGYGQMGAFFDIRWHRRFPAETETH